MSCWFRIIRRFCLTEASQRIAMMTITVVSQPGKGKCQMEEAAVNMVCPIDHSGSGRDSDIITHAVDWSRQLPCWN